MRSQNLTVGAALAILTLAVAGFIAWITHVIVCIGIMFSVGATTAQVIAAFLLIFFGAFIFPPVAIIHGNMIWFGFGFF
jgi:hypothetical protein